jgi:hypothetical protein
MRNPAALPVMQVFRDACKAWLFGIPDPSIQKYLQGETVPFAIAVHKQLLFHVADFVGPHLPEDRSVHSRRQFFADLRDILSTHFPRCTFDACSAVRGRSGAVSFLRLPMMIQYMLIFLTVRRLTFSI